MLYCGRSCRKYKIKNTTLKTAVMALAKRYTSAGKALLRSPARESIVKAMVGVLKRETRCIRRKDSLSLFTARRKWALMHFTWSELFEDIKAYAPTLCELLCSLVPLNKRVRAIPAICTMVSILLKLQSQKACLLQSVISLLLYSGGVTSQVCTNT